MRSPEERKTLTMGFLFLSCVCKVKGYLCSQPLGQSYLKKQVGRQMMAAVKQAGRPPTLIVCVHLLVCMAEATMPKLLLLLMQGYDGDKICDKHPTLQPKLLCCLHVKSCLLSDYWNIYVNFL